MCPAQVASLPATTTCLVLVNAEAVPTSCTHACVFEEITAFTLHRMLAYRNGKAAGAVQAGAAWNGTHLLCLTHCLHMPIRVHALALIS